MIIVFFVDSSHIMDGVPSHVHADVLDNHKCVLDELRRLEKRTKNN